MQHYKYAIIGNSAAAVGAVEGIRQVDAKGSILVLSKEHYHTYSRPLISYYLLGKTDRERMAYRPLDFYQKMGCEVRLGEEVVSFHPKDKALYLAGGEKVGYDKLLVATGSHPLIPPIDGLEQVERKTTFMSLDDALTLEKQLSPASRVLILGAGLIGLKCAEGIRDRVGSVIVVDLANQILSSILDEEGAKLVQNHLEAQGIHFILGDGVTAFCEGREAVLESGRTIPFDMLVVAVGVRPNIELVEKAGGQVNRGIVTDLYLKTTLEDVWSAGDCALSYDVTTGTNRTLALLPNAYMQGECAGMNMAGKEKRYDKAIPMNAIGFFGLHCATAGSYQGESFVAQSSESYKRLIYQDGLLKGFILIGNVERAGIYTSLIREQTPLDTLDFSLIQEKPQLMAFSRRDRERKLGGAK